MREKKVPVCVSLPKEISEKLTELARETHRTRSAYIRQVLRRYIKYVETCDDPDAPSIEWKVE